MKSDHDRMMEALTELFEVVQVIAAKHSVCRICLITMLADGVETSLEAGMIAHDGADGFQPEVPVQ